MDNITIHFWGLPVKENKLWNMIHILADWTNIFQIFYGNIEIQYYLYSYTIVFGNIPSFCLFLAIPLIYLVLRKSK